MEVTKEGSVDDWNSRERLYLASLVLTHGDNNWTVVSDAIKSFVNRKLRSLEWYSPEKCSIQFAWMLKDLEKIETTTDGKESRLKRLEHFWREKRLKELTEESDHISTLVGGLISAVEIVKGGTLDDYLWVLLDELKNRNDPFWQLHGEKIMESVSTSSKSEEIMARVEAPILETSGGQSSLLQNSEIIVPLKEAVKDGVDIEIHSTPLSSKTLSGDGSGALTTKDNPPSKILPTNEQSLTVINTPEKQSISAQNTLLHSSRKIESSPKAFFNPNNLLTNSAGGFFTLSSAASSQGTTTAITTTVSSVTLSAPTLSKLLEMPPSFAGKLPPLPVTQRLKTVMPVSQEKNTQKVLFKPVAIPTASGHGESNVGKFVAINVGDNLKMEAKHILIKPSDVTSFLAKTNEQLIVQESVQISPQSGETISAPTLHTDSNKMMQVEKVNNNLTKIVSVSENLASQEETITYFTSKESSQNITSSSPVKSISAEPKGAPPIGKLKDIVVSPIPQKLTPTKSPAKALESSKCDDSLDINSPSASKTKSTPTKVTKKSHISLHSGSTSPQLTLDTSIPGSDPFTFDEAAEKYSDKNFSRGIKRKRDGNIDSNVVEAPTESGVTEKVEKQIDSLSIVSPLEIIDSNNVVNSDISKLSAIDASNTGISSVSCKVPHVEETDVKNEHDKKKCKKDVKNTNQELAFSSTPLKEVVTVVKTHTNSNSDTSPQNLSPCVVEKSQIVFDEVTQNHLKSDAGNNAELGKISSNASSLEPLSEQTSPDVKLSKHEISEKNGVYDFPSDERNSDGIVKSRYSVSSKGRRGRPKALDRIAKAQDQIHGESNKEKSPFFKTEKSMIRRQRIAVKSITNTGSMDVADDDSTSSQDSDKEILSQSSVNKRAEEQCKSDAEDAFEKKSPELSDSGYGLLKSSSAIAKDASVDDSVSTSLKSTSVSTPVVRGKESKTRWSPQSVDPTSQSSMVTPTTSDSDDSDNFVLSDDSTNPDAKQSKFKWTDRKSEKKYKAWKKSIGIVWGGVANHRYANVFAQRVTDDVAPGYHNVVFRSMDLTTIKRNIDNGAIKTTEEFQRDIMMMFRNAIMYNSSDHDVYKMAVEMQADVFMQIQDLANRLSMQDENIKSPTVGTSRKVRHTKVLKPS